MVKAKVGSVVDWLERRDVISLLLILIQALTLLSSTLEELIFIQCHFMFKYFRGFVCFSHVVGYTLVNFDTIWAIVKVDAKALVQCSLKRSKHNNNKIYIDNDNLSLLVCATCH